VFDSDPVNERAKTNTLHKAGNVDMTGFLHFLDYQFLFFSQIFVDFWQIFADRISIVYKRLILFEPLIGVLRESAFNLRKSARTIVSRIKLQILIHVSE
jgi:hypothetical protein